MRRLPSLAALAVVLAALALWLWTDRPSGGRGVVVPASAAPRAEAEPAEGLAALAEPGALRADLNLARMPVSDSADLAGVEHVRVRVVADGGLPPGETGRVYVFPTWGESYVHSQDGSLAGLARSSKRFDADSDGIARIPLQARDYFLGGQTSQHLGLRKVAADEREVTLELRRSPGTLVRVVDHAGTPVGGIVVVASSVGGLTASGRTEADGTVMLREGSGSARATKSLSDVLAARAKGYVGVLRVEAPLCGEASVPFDPESPRQGPIEIRLPPSGALEVTFRTATGEPFRLGRGELRVTRVLDAAGTLGDGEAFAFEGATVRVPFVGVGERFELDVTAGGDFMTGYPAADALVVDGPRRAGETVAVPWELAGNLRFVTGRLLDEHGNPVRGWWNATLCAATERRVSSSATVQTEGDGRFTLRVLPRELERAPTALELFAPEGARVARAALPADLASGTTDLGDLRIEPAPLLVAGVVRDGTGAPIANANVSIGPRAAEGFPAPVRRIGASGARTNESGAFKIRGWAADEAFLQLWAQHGEHWQLEPMLAPAGTTDVEIVLLARGALAVRALCRREWRPMDIRVRARPAGEVGTRWYADVRTADSPSAADRGEHVERTWTLRALPPGLTEVEVLYAVTGELLASFSDVHVEPGGVARDPRLDPLDLRRLLFSHDLSFRRADGTPVIPDVVRWRPSNRAHLDEWTNHDRIGGNSIRITTREPQIDVLVGGADCRTRLVTGISGEQVIELEHGVPIRLVLPAGGGETLFVRGAGDVWSPRHTVKLDADGVGLLVVDPGRCSSWIADPTRGGPVALEELFVQDVPDGSAVQEFVLEQLARALRERER